MPTVRIDGGGLNGFLTFAGDYKPGDPPPSGYCDWHEWAEVQHKAGLRQERCCMCSKVKFPQELSESKSVDYPMRRDGTKVRIVSPVCIGCEPAFKATQEKKAKAK